jgi:putative two-component system response regulator
MKFVKYMEQASPLHDVGKVGIADAILLKPGKLSVEEFEIMKEHTLIGARTLAMVQARYPHNAFLSIGIEIARSHHEKWDGSGYPDGLSGEEIPLAARVMAVADVYDAVRSKRCYKDAVVHDVAKKIILEGSGTQFDPKVVAAFLLVEDKIVAEYE